MASPLIFRINQFLRTSGLPPTKFGRLAARDPRLVSDLRKGRQPGAALIARVEHFMNKYQSPVQEKRS